MDLNFEKDKISIGTRQVVRLIKRGQIAKVYIASDTDSFIRNKLIDVCEINDIPFELVLTKEEMGQKVNIDVFAACVGVLK